MYTISSACLNALLASTREERLYGQIHFRDGTSYSFTQADLNQGGCVVNRQCVSGEQVEIGGMVSSSLEMSFNLERSPFDYSDAGIYAVYQIKLSNNTWYDIPLGTFNVAEAQRVSNGVKVTAYDVSIRLDRRYYGQVLTGTPHEVVSRIAEICGLDFRQTVGHFSTFPNSDKILRIDSTSKCKTFRDCMKQVLIVMGGFGYMSPTGIFSVRKYSESANLSLSARNRYTMDASDYLLQYNKIVVESSNDRVFKSSEIESDNPSVTQIPLVVSNAACWNSGDTTDLQTRVENLVTALSSSTFTPARWTMPGNPAMEPGDRVEHTTDKGTFESLVTSIVWCFRGEMSVDATGRNVGIIAQQLKGAELPLKDYNGDGVIDMRDVDALRSLIVQETYTLEDDWNGDGEVNIKDVGVFRKLVQAYLGPLPNTSGATAGQYLVAKSVDENGRIEEISSSDAPIYYTEEDYGKVLSCSADGLVWVAQSSTIPSSDGVEF